MAPWVHLFFLMYRHFPIIVFSKDPSTGIYQQGRGQNASALWEYEHKSLARKSGILHSPRQLFAPGSPPTAEHTMTWVACAGLFLARSPYYLFLAATALPDYAGKVRMLGSPSSADGISKADKSTGLGVPSW